MLFAIETPSRPTPSSSTQHDMRAERRAYGRSVIGRLVIANADDLATAHGFARKEPSARAGLMEPIRIKPWRAMPIMRDRRNGANV